MRDVQRVILVDPSDATREPLRNLLLGIESAWLEAECSRYEFVFGVVNHSSPDVIVVALDSDQNKALQLIAQLSAERPELPILAVSAQGDGQSILKALRSGAREFLMQPVVLEDLLIALQRLQQQRGQRDGSPTNGSTRTESLVVAVLGSRGGIGCTSLAVNLGCTLADVAMNIDRLDMTLLKRSLCPHSTGLSLLPHPVQVTDVGLIHEDHLQRVIGLLRASYTHLIID